MAQKLNPPLLVAVDTNVALDLADQCEAIVDSINTIREPIGAGALCVPPALVLELGHAAEFGETAAKRTAARQFLRQHRGRLQGPAAQRLLLALARVQSGRQCHRLPPPSSRPVLPRRHAPNHRPVKTQNDPCHRSATTAVQRYDASAANLLPPLPPPLPKTSTRPCRRRATTSSGQLARKTRCEHGNWAKSLGRHIGRKYGEKTVRNNWMRIGLVIAWADYPAATPPLKPNISPFRDPFTGATA